MSKKTNAMKRSRREHRPRRNKRKNSAYGNMGMFSNASLIRSVETIAFGEIGCALLRALKVSPIDLLARVPDDREDAPGETIQ